MSETKKYLSGDNTQVSICNKEDFVDYLNFRKENDVWINEFINKMACYGVDKLPLFTPSDCKNIKVDMGLYSIDVTDIDYENQENSECIKAEMPFLILASDNKYVALPTRELAFNSILQRAELTCGLMSRFEPKSNKSVLPIKEKYAWITRAFSLYGDMAKVLFRDGKVSAVLSKEYQILPCDELITVLEEELTMLHENLSFMDAQVSHEYLVVRYLLNDKAVEESLRLKLNDTGCNITKLTAGIQFSSSDVGYSSVKVNIFINCDGTPIVLNGIYMPHKGDASCDKFRSCFDNFGLLFQELEEQIEKLGNMDILDVKQVTLAVTNAHPQLFPKAATETVLSSLSGGGTGMDVFIALNEIINQHITANKDKISPTRYLQMTEQVYNLINLSFDKIEKENYQLN